MPVYSVLVCIAYTPYFGASVSNNVTESMKQIKVSQTLNLE